MKRVLLIAMLLLSGSIFLFAQEGAGEREGAKSEGEEVAEVWKWANFAILAIALGYLVVKTIPPAFKARGEDIRKGISEARKIKEDADKRAAEVEAKIKTLATDIENLRTQSRSEMRAEGDRISKETAAQVARLEAQAQQEIEAAGKTAQRELKAYAAKLALDLAEQRIRGRLDSGTDAGLVNGLVQDLSRLGSGSKN
jgi:F-type H+-transporting ATPase subunit b